jgi:hypothetical protein
MEYVSRDKVATIVDKYDQQVLMFFLVMVSKNLNPRNVQNLPPSTTIVDDSLWGVVIVSIEKVSLLIVKSKLFLYCHLHVSESDVQLLLQWWKDHAKQFPRVFHSLLISFWVL